jgi:hypothetical protein
MDAEKMKLLREFKRWTTTTHFRLKKSRVTIACKKGFWAVDAPDLETAEEKALIEFEKYYSAGEYK